MLHLAKRSRSAEPKEVGFSRSHESLRSGPPAGGVWESASKWLDQGVFILLLALIFIAVIPYGSVDAWWESLFEVSVFALTALWLVEVVVRRRWEVQRLFLLLPLILITAYAFLQIVH